MTSLRRKKRQINPKREEFATKKTGRSIINSVNESLLANIEFLNKVNHNITMAEIRIIMTILAIGGFAVGILLKNLFLSLVLVVMLPLTYVEYLNLRKNQISIRIEKQIIKYAELIKNSYVANYDMKRAIAENIPRFQDPIKTLFVEFLREVDIFNESPKKALMNMNKKINTPSLRKFTEQLILCEEDRRFDSSLKATTMVLNDRKSFLTTWEYETSAITREFIVMVVIINFMLALMLFGFGDIGRTFMRSAFFKPMTAGYIMIQIICVINTFKKVNSINI